MPLTKKSKEPIDGGKEAERIKASKCLPSKRSY